MRPVPASVKNYVWMWRSSQRSTLSVVLQEPSFLVFVTGSLTHGVYQFSEAVWSESPRDPPVSVSPVLGLREHTTTPAMYVSTAIQTQVLMLVGRAVDCGALSPATGSWYFVETISSGHQCSHWDGRSQVTLMDVKCKHKQERWLCPRAHVSCYLNSFVLHRQESAEP